MDIRVVKTLLEVLASVGIEEAVLEKVEDGTLVRGANKDTNIIVYHTIPENLVDTVMGIQSVKGLLSRLQLFDVNKAAITLNTANDRIVDLFIKQGKKKASYRCAEASKLTVPKKIPGDLSIVSPIKFDRAYVDHIMHAITAMSYTGSKAERYIGLAVKDKVAEFSIYDGESDTFTDEFAVDFRDIRNTCWDVAPFQRVMKQSLETNNEHAVFTITEHGIVVFDLSFINILVAPVSR